MPPHHEIGRAPNIGIIDHAWTVSPHHDRGKKKPPLKPARLLVRAGLSGRNNTSLYVHAEFASR